MGRLFPKVHSLLGLIIHMTNCGAITPFRDTFTFKGSGYAGLVTHMHTHTQVINLHVCSITCFTLADYTL